MEDNYQLSFDFMTNFEDTGKYTGKVGIFKTKKCTACHKDFEATRENFSKAKTSKLQSQCKSCQNKLSLSIKRSKVKEGIYCKGCTNFKLPNSSMCTYHHVQALLSGQRHIGRFQHLKTKEQRNYYIEKLIDMLETQNYKCAITRVPIELGKNASLDHIQEVSQGGTCNLENLQWVDITANKTKSRKYKND